MNKLILLAGLSVLAIGCTKDIPPPQPVERLVYVTVPLQAPNKPKLPTWKAKDMSCLSSEMKEKILERDRLRDEFTEELITIIKSTQQ